MHQMNPVSASLETEHLSDPAAGGHLLIVEPDELTLWSLTTYLGRWFIVEGRRTDRSGLGLLRSHSVEALVLSDELPVRSSEALALLARRRNPNVRTVLMVAQTTQPPRAMPRVVRIEKPFALPELARLLGVAALTETEPPLSVVPRGAVGRP